MFKSCNLQLAGNFYNSYRNRHLQVATQAAASPQEQAPGSPGAAGVLELYTLLGNHNNFYMKNWTDAIESMHSLGLKGSDRPQFTIMRNGHKVLNAYTRDQITAAAMLKASRGSGDVEFPLPNGNYVQVSPHDFGTAEPPIKEDSESALSTLDTVALLPKIGPGDAGVLDLYIALNTSVGSELWRQAVADMQRRGIKGNERPHFDNKGPFRVFNHYNCTRDQITAAAMLKASRGSVHVSLPLSNGGWVPVAPGEFGTYEPPTIGDASAAWEKRNWSSPTVAIGALNAYRQLEGQGISGSTGLGMEIWQNALWAMHGLGTNGDRRPPDLSIPGLPPDSASAFTAYTRDQITVAAMLKASRSGKNITLPLSNVKNNCIQVTPGRFGLAEPPTQEDADAAAAMLNWVAPHFIPTNPIPATFTFDRSFLEAFGSYALTAECNVKYAASLWGDLHHRKKGADGASDVAEPVRPNIWVGVMDLLPDALARGQVNPITTESSAPTTGSIQFDKSFAEKGDFYLDSDPSKYTPGKFHGDKKDLITVAAHEFGHNLGLNHGVSPLMHMPGEYSLPLGQRRIPGEADAKALEAFGYFWQDPQSRPSGTGYL